MPSHDDDTKIEYINQASDKELADRVRNQKQFELGRFSKAQIESLSDVVRVICNDKIKPVYDQLSIMTIQLAKEKSDRLMKDSLHEEKFNSLKSNGLVIGAVLTLVIAAIGLFK